MTKTLEFITEAIRNPKTSLGKVIERPKKAEKHRHERRKVREYLKLGDWGEESVA